MIYAPGTYVRVLFIDKQQCFYRTQKLFGSHRSAITILIVKVSEDQKKDCFMESTLSDLF